MKDMSEGPAILADVAQQKIVILPFGSAAMVAGEIAVVAHIERAAMKIHLANFMVVPPLRLGWAETVLL